MELPTVQAYRRADGQIGVRNHVVILPVDDVSNAAAMHVAALSPGTLPLPHPYGRVQFGADLDLHFRTLIGTAVNPNVAAAIVIGIEPRWTRRVVDGVASWGRPVAGFSIEGAGELAIIEHATRVAGDFLQDASELRRTDVHLTDVTLAVKCGESDTTSGLASNPAVGVVVDRIVGAGGRVYFGETSEITGAEEVLAARAESEAIGAALLDAQRRSVEGIAESGMDLLGSQPTEGNLAGGLTTIEEKALGNIQKIGHSSRIARVLPPAAAPDPSERGLFFMDTPAAGAECLTLFAAGGAALQLFTTGQGNPIGNAITPVLKITANSRTAETMREHIDVDVSGVIAGEMSLDEAADTILMAAHRVASGRLAAAEVRGHQEFVLTRLHRSL